MRQDPISLAEKGEDLEVRLSGLKLSLGSFYHLWYSFSGLWHECFDPGRPVLFGLHSRYVPSNGPGLYGSGLFLVTG